MKKIYTIAIGIMSIIIIILLVMLIIKHSAKPYIVTVDIQKLVKDDIAFIKLDNLKEDQIEQKVAKLIEEKRLLILNYAKRNKLTVLPKQVVLSQTPDITHLLKRNEYDKK